jgi:hypothetical protein
MVGAASKDDSARPRSRVADDRCTGGQDKPPRRHHPFRIAPKLSLARREIL